MRIDGSCQCGHITFEGEADPEKAWVCHCTDCQAGTGTAFRVNVPVPGASFKMLSGTPAIFGKRHATRAGLLSEMRIADLFNDARR